jgi:hypothetical protein
MLEIVWVFGSSGSGKETFIRSMINKPSKQLIKRLGWANRKRVVIPESLKYIANSEDDPVIKKRELILNRVKENVGEDIVILIKGQDADLELGLLNKLKKMVPKADHKIIFLHTSLGNLYKRCKKKVWWEEEHTLETLKEWLDYQIQQLEHLTGFKIICLDSTDRNYKTLKFPSSKKQGREGFILTNKLVSPAML